MPQKRGTTAEYMTNNQLHKKEYSAVSSSRKENSHPADSDPYTTTNKPTNLPPPPRKQAA
jgi:hypothetical protein